MELQNITTMNGDNLTAIVYTIVDFKSNGTVANLSGINVIDQDQIYNITKEYPLKYASIMFGYIMPIILLITLVTNLLVVIVLFQKHMRTPTNIVLFAMAIVDLLTLASPSPWHYYIYTMGNYDKFLHSPLICYAHHIMTDVIPVFFHTASIWLALLLASQRYIYVCHPTLASTWCTVARVKKAIILILFVALLHQLPRFFDNKYTSIYVESGGDKQQACRNTISDWLEFVDINLYFAVYFTFRIMFVFIIPDVALIILNILLFRALRRAKNKRSALISKENSQFNNNGSQTNNSTSAKRASCDFEHQSISQCEIAETTLLAIEQTTNQPTNRFSSLFNKQRNKNFRKAKRQSTSGVAAANSNQLANLLPTSASLQGANRHFNQQSNSSSSTTTTTTIGPISAANPIPSAGSSSLILASAPAASSSPQNYQFLRKPSTSVGHGQVTMTFTSSRSLDSNRTTLMLIVVVTVFLIVEIPQALVTIVHVVFNSFEYFKDVEFKTGDYIKLFTNFTIMVSYSLNFTIYCSMSKKFRETFKDLFWLGPLGRKRRMKKKQKLQQQHMHQTRDLETTCGPSGRGRSIPMIMLI